MPPIPARGMGLAGMIISSFAGKAGEGDESNELERIVNYGTDPFDI